MKKKNAFSYLVTQLGPNLIFIFADMSRRLFSMADHFHISFCKLCRKIYNKGNKIMLIMQ
jgi:predicted transcriptional regulator